MLPMELQIIQTKILRLRGQLVMLDFDLAELYAVETKRMKEAVRRNIERFPPDFMFKLTREEYRFLRTQIASLEKGRGKHTKYPPFAFTEHGVAMLSGILNSPKAIETNIAIIRAFVALRHFALGYAGLAQKVAELEARLGREVAEIHDVLRWLGEQNQTRHYEIKTLEAGETDEADWQNRPRIGFHR